MEVKQLAASLPQPVYSASQVLSYEAEAASKAGIELYVLMQRAGQAAFECIDKLPSYIPISIKTNSTKNRVLIVAGKENNGGDGYVVAKHCIDAGYEVQVLVLAEEDKIQGDAKRALTELQQLASTTKSTLSITFQSDLVAAAKNIYSFSGELIIDAIFGIGFRGSLNLPWQNIIEAINSHHASVLSIDIPSGLNASSGHVDSVAIFADVTVTFIVLKQGLLTGKAANYIGEVFLATLDIQNVFCHLQPAKNFAQGRKGLPKITPRHPTIHKGSIGLVLAIGGNTGMPGAIRLASEAALRAGASLVAVTCQLNNQVIVSNGRPELMLAPSEPKRLAASNFIEKAKVVLIGPGLGRDEWAQQLVSLAIETDKTLVVDADALSLIKHENLFHSDWVLTPHPGEAAFLLDTDIATIEADRFHAVLAIAKRYGGVCVLKGAGSLISDGEHVVINTTGNAGMASGGMGDVLSGIIAALILQTGSILDATKLAVSIHGQAAQMVTQRSGVRGLLASDLFEPLRDIVNQY